MTDTNIHKCLVSYGFFPMTLILKELESIDEFEKCSVILSGMVSYREKFKIVEDYGPTSWSEDFEKEYYSLFKKNADIAKNNMEFYLNDIKKRLCLK